MILIPSIYNPLRMCVHYDVLEVKKQLSCIECSCSAEALYVRPHRVLILHLQGALVQAMTSQSPAVQLQPFHFLNNSTTALTHKMPYRPSHTGPSPQTMSHDGRFITILLWAAFNELTQTWARCDTNI